MGFFKKNKTPRFTLNDNDIYWVEENFIWLKKRFKQTKSQFELNEGNFPITFNSTNSNQILENLIQDFKKLMRLKKVKIKLEITKDIRDSFNTPYVIEGSIQNSEIIKLGNSYILKISNQIRSNENALIYNLSLRFTEIKLFEGGIVLSNTHTANLFLYLAGIYFGVGILISNNMFFSGGEATGTWQKNWNYKSIMPVEVMAFGLALFNDENQDLNIPSYMRNSYLASKDYIEHH